MACKRTRGEGPLLLLASLLLLLLVGPRRVYALSKGIEGEEGLPQHIREKQHNARVDVLPGYTGPPVPPHYSGHLLVDEENGAYLFYWLQPSERDPDRDPLILWLNGGPGSSSLVGLFWETGPYHINNDLTVSYNNYTWTRTASLLYIDNPAGTGFSYLENTQGYVVGEERLAAELYTALQEFFHLFPQLARNDFFIFGESYAGKYIPTLATLITQHNEGSATEQGLFTHIRLKGMGIGDGWVDPEIQNKAIPAYAHAGGLINNEQRRVVMDYHNQCAEFIHEKEFIMANVVCEKVIQYIQRISGHVNIYDVRDFRKYNFTLLKEYLGQDSVRKYLHVGERKWTELSKSVMVHLMTDIQRSVKHLFPDLLTRYHVFFYNGQFDMIVNHLGTEAWLASLDWEGKDIWNSSDAPRKPFRVEGKVHGWAKVINSLIHLVVHGAGHLCPNDQPRAMQEAVDRFLSGRPFCEG